MDDSSSQVSSLTSRSPTPEPPTQPDHFWGQDDTQCPPSPNSDGRAWLDPEDDPFAQRGIPVFKPTMEEFADFEDYMKKIECWGMRSGIVKVIPPKEWTESLPSTKEQLAGIKLKTPIQQEMIGRTGLFRVQNVERKGMSLREWVDLCDQDDYRSPGVKDVGLPTERAPRPRVQHRTHRKHKAPAESTPAKSEPPEDTQVSSIPSPPHSEREGSDTAVKDEKDNKDNDDKEGREEVQAPRRRGRGRPTKEEKETLAAEGAELDRQFLEEFDPRQDWLPRDTKPEDYTPDFCRQLERQFWRNCGIGKAAWYGADTAGSLFTKDTTSWNVGSLPSMLARLMPASSGGLPGVNMPYLYFGMWRATFAWHVEDMDLFSINYIHFGAPKFWYAVPQARAGALEQTMKSYFPRDIKGCPQFLRHKSFLASPKLLHQSSIRPNTCVQQEGEFMITYPMGYHAGINLGLNCAESVNFALDSWLDLARKAKICKCIEDSVRIDVDELIQQRDAEARGETAYTSGVSGSWDMDGKPGRKRKVAVAEEGESTETAAPKKKPRVKAQRAPAQTQGGESVQPPKVMSVKLKMGPRPIEPVYVCCLCVDTSEDGLLRVHDPPSVPEAGSPEAASGHWRAHASCANVVAETWVDEIDLPDGTKERVVFGVDGIPKSRWGLKCTICTKAKAKTHGAPIQCTKGKCSKAFHVSCARESDPSKPSGVVLTTQDVSREIVIASAVQPPVALPITPVASSSSHMDVDGVDPSTALPPLDAEPQHQVYKVIQKSEYQLLCHQHNPATYEAKKSSKTDRQRAQLLALAPMSRIKIRVSAGVFEVSLLRVIEDAGAVEVVWDRGQKREFKFSSIVFGTTKDDVVGHKPMEISMEPPYPSHAARLEAQGLYHPQAQPSPYGQPQHLLQSLQAQATQPHPMTHMAAGGPSTWSYTNYNHHPYGQYADPRMFPEPQSITPGGVVAPPVIYPRPPGPRESMQSVPGSSIAPAFVPAPVPMVIPPPTMAPVPAPGAPQSKNKAKTNYRPSPHPAPPVQPQHERFRVKWKEPYQGTPSGSGSTTPIPMAVPAPPPHLSTSSGIQHYPQVKYYSGIPAVPGGSASSSSPPLQNHAQDPVQIDPALMAGNPSVSTPTSAVEPPSRPLMS